MPTDTVTSLVGLMEIEQIWSINPRTEQLSLESVGKEKPIRANRMLAAISSVFGRAIEWSLMEPPNPCVGIKRFP